MKRYSDHKYPQIPLPTEDERKGSILVIVIALLGMLLLLGIAFFSFASQEHVSAGYFSESTKEKLPGIPAEAYFEAALEQLIVGPSSNQFQSALWGRRHSLVGNMLGVNYNTLVNGYFDGTPYNGRGAHIGLDSGSGGQFIANDYNLTADTVGMFGIKDSGGNSSFGLNLSHGAQYGDSAGSTFINDRNLHDPTGSINAPQPDVDYTSPDINNPYLAYIREAAEDPGNNRIIIPSFHMPQYLRFPDGSTDNAGTGINEAEGKPIPNWQFNPDTVRKVLSPHGLHHVVTNPTTITSPLAGIDTGLTRFLPFGFDGAPGVAGVDDNGDSVIDDLGEMAWAGSDDFPFRRPCGADLKPGVAGVDDDGANGIDDIGELGWAGSDDYDHQQSGPWTLPLTSTSSYSYQYDVDNDGDGTREGVWLDIGLPIQTLIDGRKYVPLVSFTVLDGEGLINLNTAGNLNAADESPAPYLDASSVLLNTTPVHRSNLGVSRSEVNPIWGLTSWNPGNLPDAGKFKLFSNTSGTVSRTAVANMELIHLKNGQKYDDVSGDQYNVGQWGELDQLLIGNFSAPGVLNGDDDSDGSALPTPGQPLDLRGFGSSTTPGLFGKSVDLYKGAGALPSAWPRFWYHLAGSYWQSSGANGSNLLTPGILALATQTDEPDESIIEPTLIGTGGSIGNTIDKDNVFGADEMLFLQATNSEFTNVAGNSRLQKLLPINFGVRDIRTQFTTTSFDRAEIGWPISKKRSWEYQNGILLDFPTGATGTFRPAIRNLLNQNQRFKLQLNSLLVGVVNSRPKFRSLTAHPTGLGNSPVTTPSGGVVEPPVISNTNDQEFYARNDRESLARDIYTFLYLLGTGVDSDLTDSMVNDQYSDRQKQEMAQFAVNVVDAMDTDDIITRFEYDANPRDGWTSGSGKYVFGVEAQSLTFSEWLAVRLEKADTGMGESDHPVTRQDDTTTPAEGDYWAYLELKNAGPYQVDFTDKWAWRIRKIGIGGDRSLTIGPAGSVAPGNNFVIGTTTRLEPHTTGDGKYYASDFRIDYDLDGSNTYNRILPICDETNNGSIPSFSTPLDDTSASDLDLVWNIHPTDPVPDGNQPGNKFIVSNSSNTALGIGEFLKPTVTTNPSTESVELILERRINPYRDPPANKADDDSDNPWVAVDYMKIEAGKAVQLIDLDMASPSNDTEATLRGIPTSPGTLRIAASRERMEPFDQSLNEAEKDAFTAVGVTPNSGGTVGNLDFEPTCTFKNTNSNVLSPYRLWQPHFDREFTSVYELMSIPLYGPSPASDLKDNDADGILDPLGTMPNQVVAKDHVNVLSTRLVACNTPNVNLHTRFGSVSVDDYKGVELVAANKFLTANYPDAIDNAVKYDNRWYRILDIFEVTNQTNQIIQWSGGIHYPNTSIPPRLPGAINLNTIRHRSSLLALLDDPDDPLTNSASNLIEGHFSSLTQANGSPNNYPSGSIPDALESQRDWWKQFIGTRDRTDVVSGLALPGLPGSSPYRSNLFLDDGATSVQRTLLRGLSDDGIANVGSFPTGYPSDMSAIIPTRDLFEARTASDLAVNALIDKEDLDNDNTLDSEDTNGNGRLDSGEDTIVANGMLDTEDINRNGILDSEDVNGNMVLDPGEDLANRVDYHTRHRLLRKLANNSTTRSNVFVVWMSVKFFRAIDTGEDLNGNGILNFSVEDKNENGILDPGEDLNGNSTLDIEDVNKNGILDPGEDLNGNGILDGCEAFLGNGVGGGSPDSIGVRIGGPLSGDDQPEHRGFFIVDRSLLENALVQSWTEDTNNNGTLDAGEDRNEDTNGNGTLDPGEDLNANMTLDGNGKIDTGFRFDYKKFILYRKTLK